MRTSGAQVYLIVKSAVGFSVLHTRLLYWAPTQNLHRRFMYITKNQASFWAEILEVEVSNHFSDPPKSCPMDQTCRCRPF